MRKLERRRPVGSAPLTREFKVAGGRDDSDEVRPVGAAPRRRDDPPPHRFVADHDAFDSYRLVHWNPTAEDENVLLFHAAGDPDAYERALEDREIDGIQSYEVTRHGDRSFSVHVRDRPGEAGDRLIEAVSRGSLVPVPPLEYRADWSVRLTVVGEPADLQCALANVPEGIDVDVGRVREYEGVDGGGGSAAGVAALTTRQREALRIARDRGYYAVPREASVADVAAELGCAPGTAAEHLRKAETAILEGLDL